MDRRILKRIHAFPVDRENPGPSSIKTPIKLLKEGKIVGFFQAAHVQRKMFL